MFKKSKWLHLFVSMGIVITLYVLINRMRVAFVLTFIGGVVMETIDDCDPIEHLLDLIFDVIGMVLGAVLCYTFLAIV